MQVLNALVVSLCTHKFMCLPTPSDAFFWECKLMFTNFIWESKKSAVVYDKVIQKIEKGESHLVDLSSKERSLKTIWVQRLLAELEDNSLIYCSLPLKSKLV